MTMPDLNSGALAPVGDEVEVPTPMVSGEIPRDLNGTLIRNGPNPLDGRFAGAGVLDWWPEAAMLHALTFRDGRAVAYRNRWVRTRRWALAAGRDDADGFPDTNPNVNVVHHAGAILAMAEGGAPVAVTRALDGARTPDWLGPFAAGCGAHAKQDRRTGELIAFHAGWAAPQVKCGVYGAQGEALAAMDVALDPTVSIPMMHDIAITATRTVLLDLNVGYDLSMLSRGYRLPLRWFDDRPARLGVLPRHGGPVRWYPIEPCFIQHVVNAYDEDDGALVLEAVRYPWYFRAAADGSFEDDPLGLLWRYRLEPDSGVVREAQVDDAWLELPRINEWHTGRRHDIVYAVEQPTPQEMRGLCRLQRRTGERQRFEVAPGDQNSEPVFVARPGATAEDDGWLLACVYRRATDTSDVVILDARDIREPVATVSLPRRIPAGFHGAWIDG